MKKKLKNQITTGSLTNGSKKELTTFCFEHQFRIPKQKYKLAYKEIERTVKPDEKLKSRTNTNL